jgi:hypothetical protein
MSERGGEQSAAALGDLGLLYAKMGDEMQGVQDSTLARSKAPLDLQLMYGEGQIYAVLGQPTKAISAYRRAVVKGYPRQEVWNDPENVRLQSEPEFARLFNTTTSVK